MGSKKTSYSETTVKDPWKPAQPALNTALGGAVDAFNNTYNGNDVAALDPLVTKGQNMATANAESGALGNLAQGSIGTLTGIIGNGGLSNYQKDAAAGVGGATSAFNDQIGSALAYNNPYAAGEYVGKTDSRFDTALQNALQRATEATNRQFSASGRYGSGAHSGALGRATGEISADAYLNDYYKQQQNQLAAIGQMGNLAQAGLTGNLAGGEFMSGIGQAGIANTGAIASGIPELAQAQNVDANNLAQIGGQKMDYAQTLIDSANTNPWTKAGNLAEIASAIGALGGQSVTQGQKKESTPVGQQIAGGLLGGLGSLANIGKAGGFSSLFALSDVRAKEDINEVGQTYDGQPIYSYRYKSGGPKMLGLMAQNVAAHKPEAVAMHKPTGLLMVNYDKALEGAR